MVSGSAMDILVSFVTLKSPNLPSSMYEICLSVFIDCTMVWAIREASFVISSPFLSERILLVPPIMCLQKKNDKGSGL